jgi:hypothetical protein
MLPLEVVACQNDNLTPSVPSQLWRHLGSSCVSPRL